MKNNCALAACYTSSHTDFTNNVNSHLLSYVLKTVSIEGTFQMDVQLEVSIPWHNELFFMIKNAPGLVSWKNAHSEYMACSNRLAEFANLPTPENIIGLRDEDLPWGQEGKAEILLKEDAETLSGKVLYILTKQYIDGEGKVFFIKKAPILRNNYFIGIITYLRELRFPSLRNIISVLKETRIEINDDVLNCLKLNFLNKDYWLSPREEDCAHYLLKGHTAKEIARELKISYRTVEFYLSLLKEKLKCKNTTSLIIKLLEYGYLEQTTLPSLKHIQ